MKSPRNLAGKIKTFPTDFVVEEKPLYEPCGEGEHLYITVRKMNTSHDEAVRQIAKYFGVSKRDVGCAGRKDFHAVTTQMFSVYLRGKKPEVPNTIGTVEVLASSFHTNKLRLGHLVGNRFVIRIREVAKVSFPKIQQRLKGLNENGMPNFFGPQRFGNYANNHELGLRLIQEDWDGVVTLLLHGDNRHHQFVKEGEYKRAFDAWPFGQPAERNVLESIAEGKSALQACKKIPNQLCKLWVNALQSHLFNVLLQDRVSDGTWNTLLEGDLAWKHDGGGRTFEVTKEELRTDELQTRADSFSLSPSGPLWGAKMRLPAGNVLVQESSVLNAIGLTDDGLERMRKYATGARRPLCVRVTESSCTISTDEHGTFVELTFSLPAGSYATVATGICLGQSSLGLKEISE
jgi:tRNA pseudouridine13 synthase